MMDASSLFPDGFHPINTTCLPDGFTSAKPLSRFNHPIQYNFIDFGISVVIPSDEKPKLVSGQDGQDREPPELHRDEPYDPFKLDVFLIGNLLRRNFCDVSCCKIVFSFWPLDVITPEILEC